MEGWMDLLSKDAVTHPFSFLRRWPLMVGVGRGNWVKVLDVVSRLVQTTSNYGAPQFLHQIEAHLQKISLSKNYFLEVFPGSSSGEKSLQKVPLIPQIINGRPLSEKNSMDCTCKMTGLKDDPPDNPLPGAPCLKLCIIVMQSWSRVYKWPFYSQLNAFKVQSHETPWILWGPGYSKNQ